MYISINEFLLVFYTLIEHYVFECMNTIQVKEYSSSRTEFFRAVANVEVEEECRNEGWEEESYSSFPDHTNQPLISELDQGAVDLLSKIDSEMGLGNEENYLGAFQDQGEGSDTNNMESLILNEPQHSFVEEDFLSINDIQETQEEEWGGEPYSYYPTSQVEESEGTQQWTVKVIGQEGPYLHVYKGDRTWVDIGEENATKISNEDILLLDVRETEKGYSVVDFVTLETSVTAEYVIPDEEIYSRSEQSIAI